MSVSFDNIEKFKKSLGGFVIEFSKLEFALIYYCALIDNPPNHFSETKKYLGMELEAKRNKIKQYIYSNLPGLKREWDIINSIIGSLNEDRRHLIHGVGRSYFLVDTIKTRIKKGDNVVPKKYTTDEIDKITDKLAHLLTGKNGLEGVFLTTFTTHLFNYYNQTSTNGRVVYEVNGKILTELKG